MSLAARTREAAQRHPWLVDALGAAVVNYTAAARFLDVSGDTDAVATALRRYADDVAEPGVPNGDARVSMVSGVAATDGDDSAPAESLLTVGDASFVTDGGSETAIVARGSVDVTALATALARLSVDDVDVAAAGATDGHLAVVVSRRDGADALRAVEDALDG
jgi:hypothetical protein